MTNDKGALRVALIGCGNIANAHVRGYQTLGPEVVEVVATADVVQELAQRRAHELRASQATSEYREVLEDSEVEAVDICLPHHLHAEVTIAAAKAGKHVLVEKPMACSMAEAREMVQVADRHGVVLMVGQMQRFSPRHRAVKRLISSGELGPIRGVRFDAMQNLLGYAKPPHWLYDGKLAGGGVIISVSVHKIDLMRYLVGDVRRVTGFCRSHPPFTNGAEDYASASLEFENGAVGEHFATYSGFRMPYSESFYLYGDDGAVNAVPPTGQHGAPITYASRLHTGNLEDDRPFQGYYGGFLPVEPEREGLPTDDAFANEIAHFAECCRSGREPLTSGRDNLGTMQVICGIYESARRGGVPVDLAEI